MLAVHPALPAPIIAPQSLINLPAARRRFGDARVDTLITLSLTATRWLMP